MIKKAALVLAALTVCVDALGPSAPAGAATAEYSLLVSGQKPPPQLPAPGPPRAVVTTASASIALARSSYCWRSGRRTICADYPPPTCTARALTPQLLVRRREVIRFRLAFVPHRVVLTFFTSSGRPSASIQLAATRTPSWRVVRTGPFLLTAAVPDGGEASYAGCMRPIGE